MAITRSQEEREMAGGGGVLIKAYKVSVMEVKS